MMALKRSRGFDLGPIGFLVIANIILYIFTSISQRLFLLFGLIPVAFWERPWTLLTSMFLHSPFPSFWHIIGNMITLYFFGSYLIRLVGEKRFLIIYFIGGILGNVFYLVSTLYLGIGSPYSIAIGASGAIVAVGGAVTLMRPRLPVIVFPIPAPIPLWGAVIGGFFIMSFLPGVAWQAHLGGLITGLVAGYFFRRKERRFF